MIVIFTEEESMKAALVELIGSRFPEAVQGMDWFVIDFNGKSDLEKNFPERMKRWNYGDPLFVIVRDNDGGNCMVLKKRLEQLAAPACKSFKIRIVCQELEGWFLGDGEAVCSAYPACSFSNARSKYREPDKITNASQELGNLTGDHSKVGRASMIAPHLDPARNVSLSFRVFFRTLQEKMAKIRDSGSARPR